MARGSRPGRRSLKPGEFDRTTGTISDRQFARIEKRTGRKLTPDQRAGLVAAAQRFLLVRRDIDYVLANRVEPTLVDNLSGEGGRPTSSTRDWMRRSDARNGLPIRTSDDVIAQATVAELYGKAEHLAGMTATPDMPIDLFRELHGLRTAEMPSEKAVRWRSGPWSCTCPRTRGCALPSAT